MEGIKLKKNLTLLLIILLAVLLIACTKNVTVEREDTASMQEPLYTNEIVGASKVDIEKEKSPTNTQAVEQNLQVTEEYSLQEEDGDIASNVNDELEEWIGEYTFQESISNPLMFMDYKIDVYKADDGKYYANIIINGQQTAAAIQANISGSKDKIELTFLKYLPDHMSGGYVDEIQGDSLLKFWKDAERMYTDWGKIQPMLEENSESGKEYFIRIK